MEVEVWLIRGAVRVPLLDEQGVVTGAHVDVPGFAGVDRSTSVLRCGSPSEHDARPEAVKSERVNVELCVTGPAASSPPEEFERVCILRTLLIELGNEVPC
ncbi:MAG: hypothetical protein JWO62_931 [Acidimicrobiaceae bacterium]|nr:hypothetical protein [Acidimicrobiaceae bacterium]